MKTFSFEKNNRTRNGHELRSGVTPLMILAHSVSCCFRPAASLPHVSRQALIRSTFIQKFSETVSTHMIKNLLIESWNVISSCIEPINSWMSSSRWFHTCSSSGSHWGCCWCSSCLSSCCCKLCCGSS